MHRALKVCAPFWLAVTVAACATNPVTGKRELSLLSEAQEIQIGRAQDAQVRREMGVYADRELQQYVSDIGLRLAQLSERPTLPWDFAVVDVQSINAFALPGGYLYVTRGILPFLDNEAQIAGVIGHEIDREKYLKRVDGIVYGDNPDQGVVRGSSFLHAGPRFAIDFPPGWDVTNGSSSMVAKEPGVDALIVLQLLQNPVGRTIQDVALRSMEGAGFRALDGVRSTGGVKATTLAIMNGHAVSDQPRPGELLKIVVAG